LILDIMFIVSNPFFPENSPKHFRFGRDSVLSWVRFNFLAMMLSQLLEREIRFAPPASPSPNDEIPAAGITVTIG